LCDAFHILAVLLFEHLLGCSMWDFKIG